MLSENVTQIIFYLILLFSGYLGSFLSNSLKTTQLEVNTDAKTLRPIARLKEPRDLFALPKDKEHDCPQQTARWPTECQVNQFFSFFLLIFIIFFSYKTYVGGSLFSFLREN